MNRKRLAAAIAAFVLSLTGCSLGASVDSLLSPPKLSEEQSDIYGALIKSVGGNISLVYPRSGGSAFIIESIDGSDGNQAMVFYKPAGIADNEGNVRVNILSKRDDKWRSVYDHAGAGAGIDRVIFDSLSGGSYRHVIIGFTTLSSERALRVYRFEGGIFETVYRDVYSHMFVTDLDGDGESGLVVIRPNNPETGQTANISIIKEIDGEVAQTSVAAMNPSTTEFVNIASGYVAAGRPALFIDGLAGGQLSTEIIYAISGELRNPVYLSGSDILKDTVRPSGYLCADIDGDGIIEIPTVTLFPGSSPDDENPFFITNWNVFENFSIVKKHASFYNMARGYCFIIPSRWENVVTVSEDDKTGDIVFYKYPTDENVELMRFCAARENEVESRLAAGFTEIKKTERFTYMVRVPENEDEPLILTNTEIVNNFYVTS